MDAVVFMSPDGSHLPHWRLDRQNREQAATAEYWAEVKRRTPPSPPLPEPL